MRKIAMLPLLGAVCCLGWGGESVAGEAEKGSDCELECCQQAGHHANSEHQLGSSPDIERFRQSIESIARIIREEFEIAALRTGERLMQKMEGFEAPRLGGVEEFQHRIHELRGRMEHSRGEIEHWIEERREMTPEDKAREREEIKKRIGSAMDRLGEVEGEIRKRLETAQAEGEEGMAKLREDLGRDLPQRLHEFGEAHNRLRSEVRERLGLEPLPQQPTDRIRSDLTDLTVRLLQTPQGQAMAQRGIDVMREQSERMIRHMEELQHQNEALTARLEGFEQRLDEMQKNLTLSRLP